MGTHWRSPRGAGGADLREGGLGLFALCAAPDPDLDKCKFMDGWSI